MQTNQQQPTTNEAVRTKSGLIYALYLPYVEGGISNSTWCQIKPCGQGWRWFGQLRGMPTGEIIPLPCDLTTIVRH